MEKQDYSLSITVDASAQEIFNKINNVAAWWSTNFEGKSEKVNDVFTVRFGETSITIKIVELISNQKILWLVTDCYKHWLKDKKEWVDTQISWEISAIGDKTQIYFTHIGLVPGLECYNGCEDAWTYYLKESLYKLFTEGQGIPE
ncbi:MAG: hypothetical protein JWR05_1264 [Mucilaginibacter sp.]|nr:hypothetical protein [Mucilaginibacter sp.]